MINPALFDALRSRHGDVHVRHPNIKMTCKYVVDPQSGRTRLKVVTRGQGEEYRLNCPRCGDKRGRLFVNHRWGVYDKKTKTRNLWLANCYNEQCFSTYDEQSRFYDEVYEIIGTGIDLDKLGKGIEEVAPKTLREVEMPGATWPLSDMLLRSPSHHSLAYLRDRLIDPESIAATYELSYCLDTHVVAAENRIIIPLKQSGKLVGWQARYIGEPSSKEIRKYHTGSGTALTLIWYNSDTALSYYTKVIVEGCIDQWMVGPQAMALFNKKVSEDRMKTLSRLLKRWKEIGNFVLLLDPDQNQKDIDRGEDHHINIVNELFVNEFGQDRVLPIHLPSRTDPGSLDRGYIWDLIHKVAAEKNFKVSDERVAAKARKASLCRKPQNRRVKIKLSSQSGQ